MSSADPISSETVPELPPDFGRHNMFAFGRDTMFLSHLPMFMAPHDAQLILEVALENAAFVGSLWEVVDSSASLYAQEFYRAALSGDTLGEAARKARAAIKEEPSDPTWLAYTLYGDPAATVVPA